MSLVLRGRRGAVEILTLNRPEKRNALNEALRSALVAALGEVAADPDVRAIVLTGAGDKAFAAGADVAEFDGRSVAEQARIMSGGRVYDVLAACERPVIAAINGACFGGGLELALACDIRIASAAARLGAPEVGLGLIPGGGGTQRLPRITGTGAAMKLILGGEPIDAGEALRIGLVDEVVEPAACLERAVALAERIARNAPAAVAAAKQAVRAASGAALADGLALERAAFLACFATADRAEGVRAFLDKRPAEFSGR